MLVIPNQYRQLFITLISLVGISAGVVTYLLFKKNATLAPIAIAALGAQLALLQWLVGQLREITRSRWEAVNKYYSEGDSPEFIASRRVIYSGKINDISDDGKSASLVLNFYEKWGRLVQLGYLPIEIFDGPSGSSIADCLLGLESTIEIRRKERNPRYAQSYVWLVKEIYRRGYLSSSPNESKVTNFLCKYA